MDFSPIDQTFVVGHAPVLPGAPDLSNEGMGGAKLNCGPQGAATGSQRTALAEMPQRMAGGDERVMNGHELSGAASQQVFAQLGAELFKKYCFAAGTPLLALRVMPSLRVSRHGIGHSFKIDRAIVPFIDTGMSARDTENS